MSTNELKASFRGQFGSFSLRIHGLITVVMHCDNGVISHSIIVDHHRRSTTSRVGGEIRSQVLLLVLVVL